MPTIRQFEDIQAWKDAMALAGAVYSASRDGLFVKDFGLRDQMRRAAISISSNIAEGFERDSTPEFIRFLAIAKGSSGELRSQLYLARQQGYVSAEMFESLHSMSLEVSRKIARLSAYLRNNASTRPPQARSHSAPAAH